MATRLRLARHPDRLDSERPLVLDDLLELVGQGKQDAVDACVEMLEDLHLHGHESRFIQNMQGVPFLELKTRSRGGEKGGARVYFYWNPFGEPVIVHAESKTGDRANGRLLNECSRVRTADIAGIVLYPRAEEKES